MILPGVRGMEAAACGPRRTSGQRDAGAGPVPVISVGGWRVCVSPEPPPGRPARRDNWRALGRCTHVAAQGGVARVQAEQPASVLSFPGEDSFYLDHDTVLRSFTGASSLVLCLRASPMLNFYLGHNVGPTAPAMTRRNPHNG